MTEERLRKGEELDLMMSLLGVLNRGGYSLTLSGDGEETEV